MNFSNEDIQIMLSKIEYRIAELKMSKKEFYDKSGISSSLYSQWNTGTVKPTMKSIGRAANALGVSVESLLGTEQKSPPSGEDELADELQILRDRPDIRALLHVSSKNTPEQIEKLMALIESMNG